MIVRLGASDFTVPIATSLGARRVWEEAGVIYGIRK